MDQDLLNYLEQRFSAIDQRFQETGQQIQELREETAQRFNKVDQRLDSVDQRLDSVDQRLDSVDQRLDSVDQRLDGMDQRFERLETEVREAWVVIEDLPGRVKLVAEGVANNNERLDRHAEEVSRRFDDLESLIHQPYEDLDSRVRRLEATG